MWKLWLVKKVMRSEPDSLSGNVALALCNKSGLNLFDEVVQGARGMFRHILYWGYNKLECWHSSGD